MQVDHLHREIFHAECWEFRPLCDNDTSTLVGHFVSSPRERENRDEIVEEMKMRDREERGTGMKKKKRNKNTVKTIPLDPYLLQG